MRTRYLAILAVTFSAAVFTAGPARAVTTTPGNHPQPNEELLLGLGFDQVAAGVHGTTNQSGTSLAFFNGTDPLTLQANGPARVGALDGGFIAVQIIPGGATTFQDLIFNVVLAGTGQQSGSLSIGVTLQGGASQGFGPFALAQGSNFFTIVAGPGEAISEVGLQETGANQIESIQQIQVSGVCVDNVCVQLSTPEPGTLALVGGSLLGLVGFASRRRSRR
jgi:PEP-CTERM motif